MPTTMAKQARSREQDKAFPKAPTIVGRSPEEIAKAAVAPHTDESIRPSREDAHDALSHPRDGRVRRSGCHPRGKNTPGVIGDILTAESCRK
jgi:hypothetical protein